MRELLYKVVLVEMVEYEEDTWHEIDKFNSIEFALDLKKSVDHNISDCTSIKAKGRDIYIHSHNEYMCIVILDEVDE